MKLLEAKNVVITGGGGGLGRAYGVAMAQAGAAVCVCDIDLDAAERTRRAIVDLGARALAVRSDVTRAQDIEELLDRAEAELGPVDVLVNLAGAFPKNALVDLPEAEWDAVIALNLKSVHLATRAALRRMLPRDRGVVLSAASGTVLRGLPRASAYVASKAAIIGFTKCVALELRGTNVRINCFAPGPTDTALWREGRKAEDVQRVVHAGQVYSAEAFSNVVVWLASELSSPLSGEFINRDLYRV